MENKIEIVESVSETILDTNCDFLMDLGELGIDFAYEESTLKEIPIVKTGIVVRDRHLLNKTLIFINKLNSNNLSSEEYENYKRRLKEKDKILYRELEHIIIILDKFVEKENIKYINNYY